MRMEPADSAALGPAKADDFHMTETGHACRYLAARHEAITLPRTGRDARARYRIPKVVIRFILEGTVLTT
jgi:hypothetical protein